MARIILSGGPGAGKSTVLTELVERGYSRAPDVARDIIQERRSAGLSPRPETDVFGREMLRRDQENFTAAAGTRMTFFERGVPDSVSFLLSAGAIEKAHSESLLAGFRYDNPVFIFPAWPAIYRTDRERDQTYTHAARVAAMVHSFYQRIGYSIVIVPPDTAANRADFVLRHCNLPDDR